MPEIFDLPTDYNPKPSHPPLKSLEGPKNGRLEIPPEERETLLRFVNWELTPPFGRVEGRSVLVRRHTAEVFGGKKVGGYKLKGIGSLDGRSKKTSPPSDKPFRSFVAEKPIADGDLSARITSRLPMIVLHRMVTDNGRFKEYIEPKKPLGGVNPGHGQREFETAVRLNTAGVPACGPIAWGIYPDLKWEDEPMEWVILSVPETHGQRFSSFFEPEFTKDERFVHGNGLREAVTRRFDYFRKEKFPKLALRVISDCAYQIGKLLREAHTTGNTAGFHPHSGNFSHDADTDTITLHDLDTTFRISDTDPRAHASWMIRDLEIAVAGMLISLAHSRMFFLTQDEEFFRKNNPITRVIDGYFCNSHCTPEMLSLREEIDSMGIVHLNDHGVLPSMEANRMWFARLFNLTQNIILTLSEIYRNSEYQDNVPYALTREETERNMRQLEVEQGPLMQAQIAKRREELPPELRRFV